MTLANKTVTLTEKRLDFWGTDMIICMYGYVYKYFMVISNWNYPMVLLHKGC